MPILDGIIRVTPPLWVNQNNLQRLRFNSETHVGLNLTTTNANRISLNLNNAAVIQNDLFSILNMGTNLSNALERPWMNVGTTMGFRGDIMYTGLLNMPVGSYGSSSTAVVDAVIAWGCNDNGFIPANGPDNFRFIFISPTTATGAGSQSQGRETMRITPMGNVGIGDFSPMPSGLNQQPTHRLDVAGNTRLRQVDNLMNVDVRDVLLAGKFQTAGVDFEVQHIRFTENPDEYLGGDGEWHDVQLSSCDWVENDFGIFTGFPNTPVPGLCNTQNVGIGVPANASTKLDIRSETAFSSGSGFRAVNIHGEVQANLTNAYGLKLFLSSSDNATGNRYGIDVFVSGGKKVYGGRFSSTANHNVNSNGDYAIGVAGYSSSADEVSIGVFGQANRDNCAYPGVAIGVYGEVRNDALVCNPATDDYAGFFAGSVAMNENPIVISDGNLKTDVLDLENASETLLQLHSTTYIFDLENNGDMGLPSGQQFGFIAQEVEEVLPEIVHNGTFPARLDTAGNVVRESMDFKGLQYGKLIPFLVKGFQEQQSQIETLNSRLDEMEAMLADFGLGKSMDSDKSESIRSDYELYQNRPNPFVGSTEIVWRMADEAQARIIVQDAQGSVLAILHNGSSIKGMHSVFWNAEGLSAGTYFYSLEVEGELMVKRAIKLDR